MIECKVMLLGPTTVIDDERLNILYYHLLPSIYHFKYLENGETFHL